MRSDTPAIIRAAALANKHRDRETVAQIMRITPDTVSHYLWRARKAGLEVPEFQRGPKPTADPRERPAVVSLPADVRAAVAAEARRRGIAYRDLLEMILLAVVENKLFASVLDD
jgi:hypothetical protein